MTPEQAEATGIKLGLLWPLMAWAKQTNPRLHAECLAELEEANRMLDEAKKENIKCAA